MLGLAAACGGKNTYTLYRNGALSDTLRIHVATFDADDDAETNRATCEQTRELYQLQPAALSRFWCEKGRFRKKAPKP
jgi:hypothetical protein